MLEQQKVSRYLLYAAGELALVVLGILIALRLNNLNEENKNQVDFGIALEQIYNSIEKDVDNEEFNAYFINQQRRLIRSLLHHPDSVPPGQLAHLLYYIDLEPGLYTLSESSFHLAQLKQYSNRRRENELVKQLSNYVNNLTNIALEKGKKVVLAPMLTSRGVPQPMLVFGYSAMNGFHGLDPEFYSSRELRMARDLIQDSLFRASLKTLASRKERLLFFSRTQINDAVSVQDLIREYQPDVRLLYEDVGILGTALQGYDDVPGVRSTPMTLSDARLGIWETTLQLNEGTVKFRTRNSWNENWGGTSFPEGKALFYGEDIPVKAGRYHILLNLKDNSYHFRLLPD